MALLLRPLIAGTALFAIVVSAGVLPAVYADSTDSEVVLYSGRSKSLVDPLLSQFEKDTGIEVTVRYGNTSELVLAIEEEGDRSPADVIWAQDAGAMGALNEAGRLTPLPESMLKHIPPIFRNGSGTWVATSGRARTLAYSPERVSEDKLPASVFDLTQPKWKGRIGWAPANGSFQAFVTAMRAVHGEAKTKAWLEGVKANEAKSYPKNTPIIEAIAAGEIDLGLPNHYYLLRFKAADNKFPVAQTFFEAGDVGNMLNTSGVGVLKTAQHPDTAQRLIEYLISEKAQQYFTGQVFEYPINDGVIMNPLLVSVEELKAKVPEIDLEALEDLEGTLKMLTDVGLL